MRHEQFQDNLSSYIDGTLDPAMATAMERHTAECTSCAADLAEMRRVYALLASPVLDVEPPAMYHDNVMRKVRLAQREQARSPRGVFARLGWGWTAASAVAVAALVMATVLSVGPLQKGISAGFGLRQAPATSFTQPAGQISVNFPDATATAGLEFPVSVRFLAPAGGEWRLLAVPASGLTMLPVSGTDPRRDGEVWRGPLGAGQSVLVSLRLYPTVPGGVGTLALRLERADGFAAAQETVFVPAAGRSESVQSGSNAAGSSLRTALTEFAHATGRPVSAPTEALDAAGRVVPNAGTARPIAAIASDAGLTVRPSGAGFSLSR